MAFWVTPYQATLLLNRNVKKIYIQTFEIIAEKTGLAHFLRLEKPYFPANFNSVASASNQLM
jgi:hypothetical protein